MNVAVTQPSIPVPVRLSRRPRDHRGFIIPYFVAWLKEDGRLGNEPIGTPDFRVIDHRRMVACVNLRLCWLCGEKMGVHQAHVLGPMCTINRIISEPPSHRECAEYALKVCPFLTRPRMRRNDKDLPPGHMEAAGLPAARNPGIMALWITRSYKPLNVDAGVGNQGVLFKVGPPESVTWWKEGRPATRAEAMAAIEDGTQLLMQTARQEGPDAVAALTRLSKEAELVLPP